MAISRQSGAIGHQKAHNDSHMTGGRLRPISAGVVRLIAAVALIALLRPAPVFSQGQQPGITSPAPGSTISGDVPVFGTAVIEPFQKYELHYKLEPSGDDAYIYFTGATSPVVDGQLGVWQASSLPPGVYSLRLRVVKNDGNYAEYYAPNLSVGVGAGPSPTPTSDVPTPTPIPTATFTPAPQPTPAVGQVEQPALEPTPTQGVAVALGSEPSSAQPESAEPESDSGAASEPEEPVASASTNLTRELGEAVSISRLRSEFLNGVRLSAALLLGVSALYAGKKLFSWVWTQFS